MTGLEPTAFPPADAVQRFLAQAAARLPERAADGHARRGGYLRVIESITRYFVPFQDERGAVLDPYAGDERQYSTPCFALAAALVTSTGTAADLLEPAARALDHALVALAVERNPPQRHGDFFAPLVVQAYRLLRERVEPQRAAQWRSHLESIEPEACYSSVLARRPAEQIHNWNVVAVAGEMLRLRDGLGGSAEWVEQYLRLHLERSFDPAFGLYRDPHCPLPYDLFPRFHLGYALADGYDGPLRAVYEDVLARGEWFSLLTQTGSGGIPPGWRSSEHLWNDAALVGLCEVAARRHAAAGRPAEAGAFARAAALAFDSLASWVRPTGQPCVVKNRFDPVRRHGYEGYSFQSNYGLYPAAMLAMAYLYGDDAAPEGLAPVEVGGFVVTYPPEFHKLHANASGLTVCLDLGADGHYDVTGINSLRKLGAHPLLGPPCGIPASPRYHVPEPPGEAVALGPAWRDSAGQWHSLAATLPSRTTVRVLRQDPDLVEWEVIWHVGAGGAERVRSHYRLSPTRLDVHESVSGPAVSAVCATFPFVADEGGERARVPVRGRDTLVVELGGSRQRFGVLSPDEGIELQDRALAFRSGFARVAKGTREGSEILYWVEYP